MPEWSTYGNPPEEEAPTLEPIQVGPAYSNLGERIVRVVMHVVAIITMMLAVLLMLTFIRLGAQIGAAVDRVNDPGPVVSGCPFGDEECGG